MLGKHESALGSGTEFIYEVKTIIKHQDFRSSDFENDIAIIKTTKEIEYNDYIRPICLPDRVSGLQKVKIGISKFEIEMPIISFGTRRYFELKF